MGRGAPGRLLPALAAAATGVLIGAAIVATRVVVDAMGPASLALLRYAIGFCCLLPPLLLAPRPRFARRDLVPIALLGIVQFGVLIVLLNLGLRFIPAARVALIFATMPALAMLVAIALGMERPSGAKSLGVGLTLGGVGLALGEGALRRGGTSGAWVGDLAVFGSALCGAVCSLLYRPYLRRYPALPVGALAMLASVGVLALLASREGFFGSVPSFTAGGWLAVLFIGASSGVGYVLWLWALAHAPSTDVTVFLALSPVTAIALGALFVGEPVSWPAVTGLGCVAVGLLLAQRP